MTNASRNGTGGLRTLWKNAGEGTRTPDGTNPTDLESAALAARLPPHFLLIREAGIHLLF